MDVYHPGGHGLDPDIAFLLDRVAENERLRAQRDMLWAKAQRVMNRSNSADDTFTFVPDSTLRELGIAMDRCRPTQEEALRELGIAMDRCRPTQEEALREQARRRPRETLAPGTDDT
jgi:hypothetical protein